MSSHVFVLEVSILPFSTILELFDSVVFFVFLLDFRTVATMVFFVFLLDFRIVPTVWYFLFFY